MESEGYEILAGSALPPDERRDIRFGDLFHQLVDLVHTGVTCTEQEICRVGAVSPRLPSIQSGHRQSPFSMLQPEGKLPIWRAIFRR